MKRYEVVAYRPAADPQSSSVQACVGRHHVLKCGTAGHTGNWNAILAGRQAAGIRFISFRNEQAAGYAAAAAGFLTGTPAALLTVSGPGVLHGLPGLAHATVNAWPMLHIAGSAAQVCNCIASTACPCHTTNLIQQ